MLSVNDTAKSVNEDMVVVAVGKPPLQLFQVSSQVLVADLVEGSDDAPLEKAPHALYGVGMNISNGPLFDAMIDGFMTGVAVFNPQVSRQFVRVDSFCFILYGAIDEAVESVPLSIGNLLQTDGSAALDSSSDPNFIALVGSALAFSLPAYQGFVHLDNAQKSRAFEGSVTHSLTDTMAEIPSCLVSHSQGPLELERADSLLGLAHQIDGDEPLTEGKVGIVHDGTSRHGELVAAVIAVVLVSRLYFRYARRATPETSHAIGPAQPFQQLPALGIRAVIVNQG